MILCKKNVYHLTDLKSYYDCQLVNIRALIEESIGVNKNAMQLMNRIIPRWKDYISTAFGISQKYYGEDENIIVETREGNKFAGDVRRDTSYLIIWDLERRKFGIEMKLKVT